MIVNYPVDDSKISQHFGNDVTNDPLRSKFYEIFDNKHCGVDFPVPIGTEVKVAFPGIVVRAENHDGMGNVVGIRNGNIVALYAHLNNISVKLGMVVEIGDRIGLSGGTGNTCVKPHLHFELRDLTKPSLKEMVFDPPFENEIKQYKERFEYTVNNKNTQKTLKKLSMMYFGKEDDWMLIKQTNNLDIDGNAVLENDKKMIIPNYSIVR